MRIMSDKNITKDEVIAILEETSSKFDKKVKQLAYAAIASCGISVLTLLFVFFK